MCAVFLNLAEWRIWKRCAPSLLEENYNHLLFKDRRPQEGYSALLRKFEKRSSLSHREESVIIVHLHIAVVKILRKTLIAMWQKLSRSNLFLTRTRSAFPCCGYLGIKPSWMCGADCWAVSESGTENILASDSSWESPRPPWWFIVAGYDSSRLRFGSKYSTPS